MAMTKLGALWISKTGKALSGTIEIDGVKTPIVIFDNGYKKEDNHPDKIIYLSEPKKNGGAKPQDDDNPFNDYGEPMR